MVVDVLKEWKEERVVGSVSREVSRGGIFGPLLVPSSIEIHLSSTKVQSSSALRSAFSSTTPTPRTCRIDRVPAVHIARDV